MAKEKKPPYVPTRRKPHRWCGPLHMVPVPFALAAMAFDLWNSLWNLVLIAVFIGGSMFVTKVVHFKPRQRPHPPTVKDVVADLRESPTTVDLEMEDAKYEGTGWRMLEVRKGWARVAVACDTLLVLGIGLSVGVMFTDREHAAEVSRTFDSTTVISVLVAFMFLGFDLYAHKKATQPRKPKRAWVPAFLRTNV